jgi:hypothetical protein
MHVAMVLASLLDYISAICEAPRGALECAFRSPVLDAINSIAFRVVVGFILQLLLFTHFLLESESLCCMVALMIIHSGSIPYASVVELVKGGQGRLYTGGAVFYLCYINVEPRVKFFCLNLPQVS